MSFYRSITLDHTQAGSSDTVNFVLPFGGTFSYLATVPNGGNVTSAQGYDIVFCSNPLNPLGTKLNFERVTWNATTGACEFWVQVPLLSHSHDTVIFIYYGDAAITTDQQNAPGTWDSSIYVAVYHFGDGTTLNLNDSTANALNGTNHGGTASASLLGSGAGGAVTFASVGSEYVDLGNSALFGLTTPSIQMIAQSNVSNEVQALLGNTDGNGYEVVNHGNAAPPNTLYLAIELSGVFNEAYCAASSATSGLVVPAWFTYDGATIKAYRTGALEGSQAVASGLGISATNLNIGRLATAGLYADSNIDELRISKVPLSADRILAEANAVKSGSTFASISTPGVNIRVQQIVLEVVALIVPNIRVQQAVLEIITLPNAAINTQPFAVILRGVKRFKAANKEPICKPVDKGAFQRVVDKLTEWIG